MLLDFYRRLFFCYLSIGAHQMFRGETGDGRFLLLL